MSLNLWCTYSSFWPRSQASRRWAPRLQPEVCTDNLEWSHECLVCTWGICGALTQVLVLISARLWSLQVRCQSCIGTAQWGSARLQIRHACIVEWEWECRADREHTPMVGGARCSSTSSPCAMGVMTINNNWSHDSDSLLEMTPVVSGPRMLMYGLTRSQTTTPQERSPKWPPHGKGGRYKGTDRPDEGSITLWDRWAWSARERQAHGSPSEPILFNKTFHSLIRCVATACRESCVTKQE